jgi:secreted trypsin-like serine protease
MLENKPKNGSMPVKAVIPEGKGSSLFCGGLILDSSHILTVAHCVFNEATRQEAVAGVQAASRAA